MYKHKKKIVHITWLVLTSRSISDNICLFRSKFKILRNYWPYYTKKEHSISTCVCIMKRGLTFFESRVSAHSNLLPNSTHSVWSTYLRPVLQEKLYLYLSEGRMSECYQSNKIGSRSYFSNICKRCGKWREYFVCYVLNWEWFLDVLSVVSAFHLQILRCIIRESPGTLALWVRVDQVLYTFNRQKYLQEIANQYSLSAKR